MVIFVYIAPYSPLQPRCLCLIGYWAYSGTFNREQDQRRNGVYAVKCIKYFIKVMDFMRHNDDSLKDITMDDIKSTFKMVSRDLNPNIFVGDLTDVHMLMVYKHW